MPNPLGGPSSCARELAQGLPPRRRFCRFLARGVPLLLIRRVVLQPAGCDLGVRSDPLNEDFVRNNRSPRGRHHMGVVDYPVASLVIVAIPFSTCMDSIGSPLVESL